MSFIGRFYALYDQGVLYTVPMCPLLGSSTVLYLEVPLSQCVLYLEVPLSQCVLYLEVPLSQCVLYLEVPLYSCCTVVSAVGASSGLDGYIKLWDMESGKLLKSIDGGPGTYVRTYVRM